MRSELNIVCDTSTRRDLFEQSELSRLNVEQLQCFMNKAVACGFLSDCFLCPNKESGHVLIILFMCWVKVYDFFADIYNMSGENIFITNKDGTSVKGRILRSSSVKRSEIAQNKELGVLFDFYNKYDATISKDVLDANGLSKAFRDIAGASGSDGILSKEEISLFLKQNNLSGKVREESVIDFFTKVNDYATVEAIYKSISGVGMNLSVKDYLKNIDSNNIFNIMDLYNKEHNTSIIQHIANESGSLGTVRKSCINIIRDKIAQNFDEKNATQFVKDFDAITKKMNMTVFSESNAHELEQLIEVYSKKISVNNKKINTPKYPKFEKKDSATLERLNRSLISKMMDNPEICRADKKDKEKIINRIMKYAKLNNPEKMINRFLKSKNPKVREAARNLKDSTFLDYFPVFAAAIIAQESKFMETDSEVFSENGRGVMQITESFTQDIFDRPNTFDKDFLKRLKETYQYTDSTSLYKALKDNNNVKVNLHYDVGMAGLTNKLYTLFFQIADGTFDSMKLDMKNPATIMEFVAMNYNGNKADKRDKKHENSISQVRYVYGRDVIERFRRYTPEDVKIRNYFDHNPISKKFNEVKY